MKLVFAELPWPVLVLVWALIAVMFGGIVAWFVGLGRLMFRARLIVPPPEDAKLPMGEQSYRAMSRSGEFFTSAKYRIERRLVGYGALALLGSMAVLFVLSLPFGR